MEKLTTLTKSGWTWFATGVILASLSIGAGSPALFTLALGCLTAGGILALSHIMED